MGENDMKDYVQDNPFENMSDDEKENLRKCAEQGNSDAMYKYAQVLEINCDEKYRDVFRAYEMYEDAANKGNVGAMYRLGIICYRKAVCNFVVRDKKVLNQALKWLEKAIEKECVDAMNAIGYYHHTIDKDYKKAKKFYEMGLKIRPNDEFLNGNYEELKVDMGK